MEKQTSPSIVNLYLMTAVSAALWIGLDQVSKFWILKYYSNGAYSDLGPVIIRLVWNPGMAFSIPLPTPVLLFGIVLVVLYLCYQMLPKIPVWYVAVVFGLILGGAFGNIIDRFIHDGSVVDFIDLNFWPLTTFPVFNVADIGISVSTALLFVIMLVYERNQAKKQEQQTVEDDESTSTDAADEASDDADPANTDPSNADPTNKSQTLVASDEASDDVASTDAAGETSANTDPTDAASTNEN